MYLLKRRWNAGFLWLLILSIKSHLSWKFHWNSSSRIEDMKNLSANISYFHRFLLILGIFWHFLVTKKLITSAYDRWCQHFFTFNILQIDCLKLYKVILILNNFFLNYEVGEWVKLNSLEKTTLKKPSLIRVKTMSLTQEITKKF